MNTLLVCLFISLILPFLAKVPLALAMHRQGGYDNRLPRLQQQRLDAFGARANAAHYNAFEAITYFAPAALVVIATGNVNETAELNGVIFVIARVLYHLAYLADWHLFRSTVWVVGVAASFTLFMQVF